MKAKAVGELVVFGGLMVGFAVVMVKVQRTASKPDFGKTAYMGFWRGVKGVADKQSMWWGEIGLKAGTQYNKCRL